LCFTPRSSPFGISSLCFRVKADDASDPQDELGESSLGRAENYGELLKLGFELFESTVAKCLIRHRRAPSQTWRTFLENHAKDLVSSDFFVVPTAFFRALFVFVILSHDRRRVVHVAVTEHPTSGWVAHQLLEAFPGGMRAEVSAA
jgi:hypothetical protein